MTAAHCSQSKRTVCPRCQRRDEAERGARYKSIRDEQSRTGEAWEAAGGNTEMAAHQALEALREWAAAVKGQDHDLAGARAVMLLGAAEQWFEAEAAEVKARAEHEALWAKAPRQDDNIPY